MEEISLVTKRSKQLYKSSGIYILCQGNGRRREGRTSGRQVARTAHKNFNNKCNLKREAAAPDEIQNTVVEVDWNLWQNEI
jgi:hypothetical protein